MKSIYVSEEQALFLRQVDRFVDEVVVPNGEAWEAEGRVPREVLRRMGELGFLGLRQPVDYGGAGAATLDSVLFAEALARSTFGGFSVTVLVHTDMASPHLRNAANREQLDRYMPGVVSGEILTAIAVTEPDAGSDVAGLRTRAVRDGDSWRINGSKMFITNGTEADLVIVAARTDPAATGHRGISLFLVEAGTPGFTVSRKLDKLGWRSSDTAELAFDDCCVSAAQLLGEEGKGFYAIMRNFQNERLVLAAMAIGEAREALRRTREYASERRAFGKTLWDQPVIRHRLAELASRVEAARQLVYHAAWLAGEGETAATREVSMAKAVAGELVNEVMYACQQFHGGMGYVKECAIERMVRDARILSIGGGATEVLLEEVAKRLGPGT